MLLALAASVALCAPLDDLDVRVFDHAVRYRHSISGYAGSHEEERIYVRDIASACKAIGGEESRELLLLAGAIFSIESENTVRVSHDGGIGWGPGALQREEVFAAARRLEIKVDTEQEKTAVWGRFIHDPTFCVWVSVRHIWRLLEAFGGKTLPAVKRHNPNSKHYVGDVLLRHAEIWDEFPPILWNVK